uniref:RNA-directed DNA polymerase, eukaryota n=1 Tax=Tanacetum cinerariifolium TaxID=118510 RepID=A0A6L2L6I4_TANCI|nr:hypothetical protein [Tanacetum cinerariifolium]
MGVHNSNPHHSKEDQTSQISKSVFITNFPEGSTAKDLWKVCNDYGTVVDVFIPFKKSKAGDKHRGSVKSSFASVLKEGNKVHASPVNIEPTLVLDDSCIKEYDFSSSLMGKIKDVSAMPNLYTILSEEGFQNIKITYVGGMWVLLELDSIATKEKLLNHTRVGSWFSIIKQASDSFESDERIIWVLIEGLLIKAWTSNSFRKISSLWGELVEWEDKDSKSLSCKHMCLKTKPDVCINGRWKIIVQGKVFWIRAKEMDAWTPTFHDDPYGDSSDEDSQDDGMEDIAHDKETNGLSDIERVSESSFMQVNDSAQEYSTTAKQEMLVSQAASFVFGIHSKSDYFVAIMGTWSPSSTKLLVISVYAPQGLREKWDLWNYLRSFIDMWEGETVIMGDFNEVRFEHERFGTLFNRQGANAFNSFIYLTGLIDLPLEGYAFTWAHKSASKMSKLDQFLISKGLLTKFPHLSALCLDIHLSDHRPILMRESCFDFGPMPLRVFILGSQWKVWVEETITRLHERKKNIKLKLSDVDKIIDQGKGNEEVVNSRSILLKELQDLSSLDATEISQKPKVRWSIEGDETQTSGLKINFHKSKLMRFGVNPDVVNRATSMVDDSTFTSPFKYLGVKVGANMSRISSWADVINKEIDDTIINIYGDWLNRLINIRLPTHQKIFLEGQVAFTAFILIYFHTLRLLLCTYSHTKAWSRVITRGEANASLFLIRRDSALLPSESGRISYLTRGGGPEGQDDREVTPPFTKEQIEGHVYALRSLIKDHNRKNKTDPIQLDFDEEVIATKDTRIVKIKDVVDDDLRKPFKEALKTPLTRRITEFSGPEYKMPTNIKLYNGTTDPEDHLGHFASAANSGEWPMPVWYRMFQQTLDGPARGWAFTQSKLPKGKQENNIECHTSLQRGEMIVQHETIRLTIEVSTEDVSDEPLIVEAEVEGYLVRRTYVDGGASVEVMFEHCFENLSPTIKARLKETQTDLVGFAGEATKPLVIRAPSPYNVILGRTCLRALRAIPSTIHSMMKSPTPRGITTLVTRSVIISECQRLEKKKVIEEEKEARTKAVNLTEEVMINLAFSDQLVIIEGGLPDTCKDQLKLLLKDNMDVFAWEPADMTGVP